MIKNRIRIKTKTRTRTRIKIRISKTKIRTKISKIKIRINRIRTRIKIKMVKTASLAIQMPKALTATKAVQANSPSSNRKANPATAMVAKNRRNSRCRWVK